MVRSTAVRDDNPEIIEARRRSIPVIPRAEMLAELMRMKPYTVAVAGSHGKTTTTSMVATVLGIAGLDPTFVVGGIVRTYRVNARLGKSELMVVEADESDRSFLMLTPMIAVVTNIDREHMDYYHDMEDVRKCFADFVNKVPFYGAAVLCLDDPHVQAVIPNVTRRRITYGLSAQADISAHDITYDHSFGSTFHGLERHQCAGSRHAARSGQTQRLQLAGGDRGRRLNWMCLLTRSRTRLRNSAAPIAAFNSKAKSRASRSSMITAIIRRRSKRRLSAARIGAPNRRIVVLFQPHRYTRTQDLMDEFASAFNNADVLAGH